ncbi:methionyl-tRNA formyltransferase-like protein [Xylaria flabelliformis]|nr:methionyl-tRNA formyltransferase-like protein [Xylaria flabelliformis]
MSHILGSLETTAKSVTALFSSRSSRRISSSLLRHSRHEITGSWRLHAATQYFHRGRRYSTTPRKVSDPLHILFCGSDEFSCASLKALHDEHVRNPDLIRSIDVVVRPGKRTGRGLKAVKDPPIRSLAESLKLQIHVRDTFTGWNMPSKTNLIIAVSFGLFVPPRLLRKAKYGGLNLHPSLLPDLRGPAPLQHTLLTVRKTTGVSLQTLDDKAFDHGLVLAQTSSLPVPRTVSDLQAMVTPIAANMLIDGLRAGLHVPPLEDKGWKPNENELAALVHAPKITKADRRLTSSLLRTCERDIGMLVRRQDAIGPLWFESRDRHGWKKRVIIESLENLPAEISDNNRKPATMLTETPPFPSSSRAPAPPYRQYLIPFEEEEEGLDLEEEGAKIKNTPQYLVFWDSPFSSIQRGGEEKYDDDTFCLGNYRVLSLKVEGDRAKPARLALQNFISAIKL